MAKHEEVAQYYPLIMTQAQLHYHKASPSLKRVIELYDLFVEGVIGAMSAIDTFKPGKAPKTAWVKFKANCRIIDFKREIYPIPQEKWKLVEKLKETQKKLLEELKREPSYEELANQMNVPVKKIHEIESFTHDHVDVEAVTIIDKQNNPDVFMRLKQFVKCIGACIESDLTGHEGFVWIEREIYKTSVPEIGKKIRRKTKEVYRIRRRADTRLKRCLKKKGWSAKDFPEIFN